MLTSGSVFGADPQPSSPAANPKEKNPQCQAWLCFGK
jgi:hypothetical protein